MLERVWLTLMTARFGPVTDYTGMIQRVVAPLIRWANTSRRQGVSRGICLDAAGVKRSRQRKASAWASASERGAT